MDKIVDKNIVVVWDFVCIFIVGDVMLDCYWFGEVNCILLEVLVLVVCVECKEECLGGVVNVVCNIVSLGVQMVLLGVIGDDELVCVMESMLGEMGICSYFNCDFGIFIIVKLCVIGCQQQLVCIDFEEVFIDMVLCDKFM